MTMSGLRPLIALTMGDAAGIGPEVLVRAALDPQLRAACRMVAAGHPEVLERVVRMLDLPLRIVAVERFEDVRNVADDCLACVTCCAGEVTAIPAGVNDGRAGRAAYDCLIAAGQAALNGQVDGITTAPLSKAALHAGGLNYPGHTEILGELCGVTEFGMMLYLPHGGMVRSPHGLGVVHTTLHTSIRSVPGLLSIDGIASHIRLMDGFLRRIGCETPRVAVCALNPHAGEGGLFGDEEAGIIAPAVEQCREQVCVTGPLPADTLMRRAVLGEFDGVVSMYHDQGHIAFKLIGFDRAVNITLGLPIVRTSPSHGTAFDIAWQGRASADGMIAAIQIAARLAESRKR